MRLRASHPATYCSSTPRVRAPAIARWHTHLYGLVTVIHEICGLYQSPWPRPDLHSVDPRTPLWNIAVSIEFVRANRTRAGSIAALLTHSTAGSLQANPKVLA